MSLLLFCGQARAGDGAWRERLDRAERLSQDGKSAESAAAARGALADAEKTLGPGSPEIAHILARLTRFYEAAGDAARFPEMEKRLSVIKPKSFEVSLALGTLLLSEDKSLAAEAALKEALAAKPDDPDAESELGRAEQDLGQDEDAVKHFKKAIEGKLRNGDLYTHLARSDLRLGRSAEAKEAFDQARKLDGKQVESYIEEGYFRLDAGDSAGSKEAFESAIAADTANPAGYHHLASYLIMHGQYTEAEKYFRQALEREKADPNGKVDDILHTLTGLGKALDGQGRSAEAEAVLRECWERPQHSALYINCLQSLGMIYSAQGKNTQAEEAFRKCLETPFPNDIYVNCLQSLGGIYASRGESARAEKIYARATDECEKAPVCSCRGKALIGLGGFYASRGRKEEAAAAADEAEKLCAGQSDPSLFMDLAGLYAGEVFKREALYRRVLAMPIPFKAGTMANVARSNLAGLDMTQGRFREAEDLYRQAVPVWEKNRDWLQEAAALDGLAAACEKEGKLPEAAEAREKAKALRVLENKPN